MMNKKSIISSFMVFRLFPFYIVILIIIAAAIGPITTLITQYTGKLVDFAIDSHISALSFQIIKVFGVLLSLVLVGLFFSVVSGIISNRIDEKLNLVITEETLRLSGKIDYLKVISAEHRDDRSAFADDALAIYISAGTNCALSMLHDGVRFIAFTIVLYGQVGYIGCIAGLATIILSMLLNSAANRVKSKLYVNTTKERRKMNYIDELFVQAPSFFELTLFGFLARLKSLFIEAYSSLSQKQNSAERKNALFGILIETIMAIITISATFLLFLTRRITTAGEMTVVFVSFAGLLAAGRSVGLNVSIVQEMIHRVKLFDRYIEKYSISSLPEVPERVKGSPAIKLRHVSFTYEGSVMILKDISFQVEAGQTIAIVGENGAGKTTLANIILGLFPCNGDASIFGRNAYAARMAGETDSIAVLQNVGKYYSLTLEDNIAFGDKLNKQMLQNADNFFRQVDFNSVVGERFGGKDYSGGSWQKIALARCANNPAEIVILDEPTAALDPIAEIEVFERFMTLFEGKTRILITHRLGSIKNADKILVLKDGYICEQGTHDELMRKAGYYADMFIAQAKWYIGDEKK